MTDHVPYKLIATRRAMKRNAFIRKLSVATSAAVAIVIVKKIDRHIRYTKL